jgi:hypothetical protein
MGGRRVQGRDGRVWSAGRRWLPWRPHRWSWRNDAGDLDLPFDFDLGLDDGFAAWILVVLVIGAAILIFWPVLEILLLVLLVVGGAIGRFVFRRPWRVVAETDDRPRARFEWSVVGWRESGELLEEIVLELQSRPGRPRPGGREPDRIEEARYPAVGSTPGLPGDRGSSPPHAIRRNPDGTETYVQRD